MKKTRILQAVILIVVMIVCTAAAYSVGAGEAPSVTAAPTAVNGLVYSGAEQVLVTAGTASAGTMQYSTDGSHFDTALPTGKDSGRYTVYYKATSDGEESNTGYLFVTIEQAEIGISWVKPTLVYNGTAQAPTAIATGLFKGDSCTLTVSGAVKNAGTEYIASVTELSNKNYKIPKNSETLFDILPKEISITWEKTTFIYDGKSHVPTVSAGGVLRGDHCSVIVIGAQMNAGSFVAIAEATDNTNYTVPKSNSTFFKIQKKTATVTINPASSAFGSKISNLTAYESGIIGNDRNVYSLSTKATPQSPAGTYDIIGTCLSGNYDITFVGGKDAYTVTEAGNYIIDLKISGWTYGETPGVPSATSKYGVISFTYSDREDGVFTSAIPVLAGTYFLKATVESTDVYSGATALTSFTISKAKVDIPARDTRKYVYNGSEQTYDVPGSALYRITGNKLTNAGSSVVIIALNDKDNYCWSDGTTSDIKYDFVIDKLDISSAVITLGKELVYNGRGQTQTIESVELNGQPIPYTVSGNKATNVGKYTLSVSASGNYTGTATKEFTVSPKEAGRVAPIPSVTYDGNPKAPAIVVNDGDTVLTAGKDYTVSYSHNVNAGMAKVLVSMKGNYAGSTSATFEITAKTLGADSVCYDGSEFIFDGKEKTPAITAADGDKELTEGTDYTVSYTNNVSAGTGYVKVTFCGNYRGEATVSFTIRKDSISGEGDGKADVMVSADAGFLPGTEIRTVTVSDMENVPDGYMFITDYDSLLDKYEALATVYGVSMWLDGKSIQPSDIGSVVTVRLRIPETLAGKEFRVLHVHGAGDVSEIVRADTAGVGTYFVSGDGYLVTKLERFSEFAFIYSPECSTHWISLGILGIFAVLMALSLFLFGSKLFVLISGVICIAAEGVMLLLCGCALCPVFAIGGMVIAAGSTVFVLLKKKKNK